MCEFISWKEITLASGEVEILFLTNNDVFNTQRGRELQAHTVREDWVGHGAIAFFCGIDCELGRNRECTDFSDPGNFPPVIAAAIKTGRMSGLCDQFPVGLLTPKLNAACRKKRAAANAEWQTKCDAANADAWWQFADPENRTEKWR